MGYRPKPPTLSFGKERVWPFGCPVVALLGIAVTHHRDLDIFAGIHRRQQVVHLEDEAHRASPELVDSFEL